MFTIRPYQDSDQNSLVSLWRATGLATRQNDPVKDIQRKLSIDPELLLIAELDGECVGSVMVGYEGHRGWINYLAVAPNSQRHGIATRLMRHAESELLARGCPKINLQVRNTNNDVLAFYASLGYLDDNVVGLGKRLVHD